MKPKFLIPLVLLTLFVGSIPTLLSTIVNKENFETRYIASGGMEPTLHINDRVFFDKIKYKSQDPQRGEIIIFSPTKILLAQGFTAVFALPA